MKIVRARQVSRGIIFLFVAALQSCSIGTAPPLRLTPALVASGRSIHADAEELALGRALFVTRCTQCHVLPDVSTRSEAEWPKVLRKMAPRAHLSLAGEEAVLAYLLAARATL